MENECNSTVTIPLKEYIGMRDEIASLKNQVQEKTIIKYVSRMQEFEIILPLLIGIIILAILFIYGHLTHQL